MPIKSGPCWSCRHCIDIERVSVINGEQIARAGCGHPINDIVWGDFRSKAFIDSMRGVLTAPEGGPLVLKIGSPLAYKWPITFLPDNIKKCGLYEMRVDLMALEMYRNQNTENK